MKIKGKPNTKLIFTGISGEIIFDGKGEAVADGFDSVADYLKSAGYEITEEIKTEKPITENKRRTGTNRRTGTKKKTEVKEEIKTNPPEGE